MIILLCLLIFLPKILAGFLLAHLLWKDLDFSAVVFKFSIGVPLGLAMGSSLFFIAVAVGISPHIYSWIELWSVVLLVILYLSYLLFSKKYSIDLRGFSWQDVFGAGIVLAGAVLTISAFLYFFRLHPYGFEDAWSIWNLPARHIFRANSADILLHSRLYNRFHPDYPIDLSLNVAWGWLILKSETPRLPAAIALLAILATPMVAWSALRKWKGAIAAGLAALVILVTSNFRSAIGQYADPLLALYILSAAALFYTFLKVKNPNLLLLAGLLTGFSAWVKNEGMLFIIVFIVVCLLAVWKGIIPGKSLKSLTIGLIFPLLIVLLYKFVVAWQNDLVSGSNSPLLQILDLSRWIMITRSFLFQIWSYAYWPISVMIFLSIYALLLGFDAHEFSNQILLLLLFLGQLLGYFLIYLITPHDLQLHIRTSMERLVSHIFPLAVFWLFVGLRSPELNPVNKAPIQSKMDL